MKELILLRHAKSSWKHQALIDFERPLNNDGLLELMELQNWIDEKKIKPEIILCSPSVRTYQTFVLANRSLKVGPDNLKLDYELYESGLEQYITAVKQINPSINKLLIIGHNPAISMLAQHISNYQKEVLTGCLLNIKLKINNWNKIQENCGTLVEEFIPTRHKK